MDITFFCWKLHKIPDGLINFKKFLFMFVKIFV